MIERCEAHAAVDPFTGATFLVQFWDTHKTDRHGKPRMCVAVWQQNPSLPSCYSLTMRSRDFCPGLMMERDGEAAARDVIGFLGFEDISPDELEFCHVDDLGEVHLT